jgi:diacylglycerol kinase (ATP)
MGIYAVVNPAAGGGRAGVSWPRIRSRLENAVGPFEHALTAGVGDATRLAHRAIGEGAELVISVGGDGTANEVLNGFSGSGGIISQTAALGIVPCGTGSDFMRGICGSTNPHLAIERLGKRIERRIDVCRAEFNKGRAFPNSRLFLNAASLGFSGAVCHNMATARPPKFLPSRIAYLAATLSALRTFRPSTIRLTIDGAVMEKEIMLAAIANGRYFGAGMKIAPDADMQDGLLEVITLARMSKAYLIRKIAHVYRGTHTTLPEVDVFRGKRIGAETTAVNASGPIHVETDGENSGLLNCEFSVEKQALRFAQ